MASHHPFFCEGASQGDHETPEGWKDVYEPQDGVAGFMDQGFQGELTKPETGLKSF